MDIKLHFSLWWNGVHISRMAMMTWKYTWSMYVCLWVQLTYIMLKWRIVCLNLHFMVNICVWLLDLHYYFCPKVRAAQNSPGHKELQLNKINTEIFSIIIDLPLWLWPIIQNRNTTLEFAGCESNNVFIFSRIRQRNLLGEPKLSVNTI